MLPLPHISPRYGSGESSDSEQSDSGDDIKLRTLGGGGGSSGSDDDDDDDAFGDVEDLEGVEEPRRRTKSKANKGGSDDSDSDGDSEGDDEDGGDDGEEEEEDDSEAERERIRARKALSKAAFDQDYDKSKGKRKGKRGVDAFDVSDESEEGSGEVCGVWVWCVGVVCGCGVWVWCAAGGVCT